MKSINYFIVLFFTLLLFPVYGQSQNETVKWNVNNSFEHKVFIENKGQFNGQDNLSKSSIRYALLNEGIGIYFTAQGLTYRHDEFQPFGEEEKDYKEKNPTGGKAGEQEEGEQMFKRVPHYVHMDWLEASPNTQIIAEDTVTHYFTYPDPNDKTGKSSLKALAYKKIIYKNIYPNIDVEYSFPESKKGIKYTLILHPGADVSMIKMNYSVEVVLSLDKHGNIQVRTPFGNIVDHAPKTFYDNSKIPIMSSFNINNNTVTFKLANFNPSQTVIIDPWTTNPNFPVFNSAFDVEYDFQGNVYVHGGYGSTTDPFQEIKFNSAGVIQWVYTVALFIPPFGSAHYGDFAVDGNSGSSYIVEGANGNIAARVIKLNAAGVQVGLFPGSFRFWEMWRIVFNNCTKTGVIGGANPTNSGAPFGQVCVLDTNVTTMTPVNVLSANEGFHDMCLLALDNSNNCYMATAKTNANFDNVMLKAPLPNLLPVAYMVPDNHKFQEMYSVQYLNNPISGPGSIYALANGFNGMAVSGRYLYTYDGSLLQRWNKNTGILINSATIIPPPPMLPAFTNYPNITRVGWGGIAVDDCENIFVGKQSSVAQYDTNFTLISTIPMANAANTVYDVKLAPGNLLYACGKGFVSSIQLNNAPCNPLSLTVIATGSCTSVGAATVTVSGGVGPYIYLWNPTGQTTQTATGLSVGTTYTVIVTDTSSCTPAVQTATVAIASSGTLPLVSSQTNILCNGSSNGSASVIPSGGTAPYIYSWLPSGGTNGTANNLTAGTYTVIVTDAAGCSSTQTFAITEPLALTAIATFTPATCGNNDGMAAVTASGGTGALSYVWNTSPSQSTQTATGLGANTYTVTITDVNGCTQTAIVTITNSNGPAATISSQTNVLCNGNSTGSVAINVNGGTVPYTYSWNTVPAQNTANVTGLSAGAYNVTVTDAAGCTQILSVTITEPAGISISISSTQALCDLSTGTADASVTGGIAAYTYGWSNGQNTQLATGLNESSYIITVTDANGCTKNASVIITEIPCPCPNLNLALPNAFSPNNDGENDGICLQGGLQDCITGLKIIIYDRWGEKVFKSTDKNFCWEGIYRGNVMNTAVFVYYLEATLISGEQITRRGNISLIR